MRSLIFRRLEKKKLGMFIRSRYNVNVEQIVVIANVDDTYFCTIREHCEMKMHEIITCYAKMYEATGVKVQKNKFQMFCWKWDNNKIKKCI